MLHNKDMKRGGNSPATKKALGSMETLLRERIGACDNRLNGIDQRLDTLTSVIRRVAVDVVEGRGDARAMREDFSSAMTRMNSHLTTQMDAFMANTLRADKIGGRISQLERRAL
jgi:hypothetical protein